MKINILIPQAYDELLLQVEPSDLVLVLEILAKAHTIRHDYALQKYVFDEFKPLQVRIVPDGLIEPATTIAVEEYKAITASTPITRASSIDEEIPF